MRPRLSYANVIATVALFIALGGTSYAALRLPRDSVGATQIRAGAVRSSEVRDGSLRADDLSAGARQTLGGGGRVFFAAVGAGGKAERGNSTSAAIEGTGHYEVGFSQPPASCAWTATLGTTDDAETPAGRITVHRDGDHVGVQTYDAAGNPQSLPFHLIMVSSSHRRWHRRCRAASRPPAGRPTGRCRPRRT